jgi:predicted GH43/DUF377 family glycosyl hydrolase
VNPSTLFRRHPGNPILTPADWPVPVNAVCNPAVARTGTATVLVCRVEDTRGISHLWAARSDDGLGGWRVDPAPLLSPRPGIEDEQWGFEDPRLVRVDELGTWVLTGTAFGPPGPAVFLATTDLDTVDIWGTVCPPEDKNAALLARRVGGEWVLFHRPVSPLTGPKPDIWLSRSTDLVTWRNPQRVLACRDGAWWDAARVGLGPPPLETPHGWLVVYHGVRTTVAGGLYRVGLALVDRDEPGRVLHRSPDWVLSPATDYERIGDVPNVVFPCGAVHDPSTDEYRLYYGAADTVIAVATARLGDLLTYLRSCPADPGGRHQR